MSMLYFSTSNSMLFFLEPTSGRNTMSRPPRIFAGGELLVHGGAGANYPDPLCPLRTTLTPPYIEIMIKDD
ncbi:hypothetical protein TRIUR3_28631 [Triticum urartu]|uniref:Uncharacterized protein n=1 Tax=Triticum urartu TaxID=4572 RepID=M7Y7I8_TRIUA|nr:hypothetical protein TRIUR3_28631 [Triticum urartu]